jgi:2-polyprenyl-3-methyl-5-hydroxy-6-metoxy-1,4-benzoquinol methylase
MSPERIVYEHEENKELVAQHVSRYEFARKYVENKIVADIACGNGSGSAILDKGDPSRIIGIDISADAISYANKHFRAQRIEFIQGDVTLLRSIGRCDIIVSLETIEHIEEYETFLSEITKNLAPAGTLIISTPVRQRGRFSDRPENPFHVQEWNAQEFDALLARYFSRREIFHQYVYKKLWYPGSRTVSRTFARMFHPEQFKKLELYDVIRDDRAANGAPTAIGYIIEVCQDARNTSGS